MVETLLKRRQDNRANNSICIHILVYQVFKLPSTIFNCDHHLWHILTSYHHFAASETICCQMYYPKRHLALAHPSLSEYAWTQSMRSKSSTKCLTRNSIVVAPNYSRAVFSTFNIWLLKCKKHTSRFWRCDLSWGLPLCGLSLNEPVSKCKVETQCTLMKIN